MLVLGEIELWRSKAAVWPKLMARHIPQVRISSFVLGGDDNGQKQGMVEGDANTGLVGGVGLPLRSLERWILPDIRRHFKFLIVFVVELDLIRPLQRSCSISCRYGDTRSSSLCILDLVIEHRLRPTSISVYLRQV
jgi:hypothetical protein